MTTITITSNQAVIDTDTKTAMHLLNKNPRCTSEVNDGQAHLVYELTELNTLTALIKSYKI
jgi:hypothetical protein